MKAKKIFFTLLTAISSVGMLIWCWLAWKNSNPAIVAFGPIEPAISQLRWELARRVLSGLAIFSLWLAGIFGLARTRTESKAPSRATQQLRG
jgi:hypothetical protein